MPFHYSEHFKWTSQQNTEMPFLFHLKSRGRKHTNKRNDVVYNLKHYYSGEKYISQGGGLGCQGFDTTAILSSVRTDPLQLCI